MADVETNRAIWEAELGLVGRAATSGRRGGAARPRSGTAPCSPASTPSSPPATILEIAPGYGRWTQYLKDLCDQLVVVDLAERCIDALPRALRRRRPTSSTTSTTAARSRWSRTARSTSCSASTRWCTWRPTCSTPTSTSSRASSSRTASAFLHHSTVGDYGALNAARAPDARTRPRAPLVRRGALIDVYAWRAESVTADGVRRALRGAGLVVRRPGEDQLGARRPVPDRRDLAVHAARLALGPAPAGPAQPAPSAGGAGRMAELYARALVRSRERRSGQTSRPHA